eukprot:TRINITY_DN389_c0_g1_i8.p1 TRINITY_DN389_c0_g1~~TRINITY_DN389_c0_g1_i8.p1  ORF type:complete len:281 (+),score=73.97 TRINITY_DN389_c0_g1_i8:61-843(+)
MQQQPRSKDQKHLLIAVYTVIGVIFLWQMLGRDCKPNDDWRKSGASIPKSGDGQITMNTGFGQELNKLAKQDDVELFLEIGTWFGGGSSLCIAKGLKETNKDGNKWLYTLEIFEDCWQYARQRLADYPVRAILGGSVPTKDYLTPEQIPEEEKTEHYKLYYERDLKLSKFYEPMLKPLCENHKFDAVFIDGNEYTGWAEFKTVRDYCKPKYLALHDCGTLKTIKVQKWLAKHSKEWELTKEGEDGGAKWAMYRHLPSFDE